jgi:4-hydroxybutyryl-CoA dehydratase/vinylacetyl-CoA-Delta-isomerase
VPDVRLRPALPHARRPQRLLPSTRLTDDRHGTDYSQRFLAYLHDVQDRDLTLGIAMTDAKGDRSQRPGKQLNRDAYVHIKERRQDGVVIRGTKAIVTGAPYMHEFLVMPCRTHVLEDKDFAAACAVPCGASGVTIIARPAGRPSDASAKFAAKYGQSVGVVMFDDVFVPHERVFLAGETEEGGVLTTSYATHHRHSCIGARAGFGDLLIGAGALMIEANGLDPDRHAHIREAMVELITITEGFYACGVAASVYCTKDKAGSVMPDAVFSNIGKLLLATKIYDMHRLAHYVSGGLIVALPGPDEDHNPETKASLAAVMGGRPDIPAAQRAEVARFIEDLTVSHEAGWYSVISLHGGGSPEAMKREIWRNYCRFRRIDPATGEVHAAHLFVAVLGASSYTYAEARWTETLPDWIGAHVNALDFLGGVMKAAVPDNLKAGITKPSRYEPGVNRTYQELADHYGFVVLPARIRKPRDKAKVEVAVQIVSRYTDRNFLSRLLPPPQPGQLRSAAAPASRADDWTGRTRATHAKLERAWSDLSTTSTGRTPEQAPALDIAHEGPAEPERHEPAGDTQIEPGTEPDARPAHHDHDLTPLLERP